MRPLRYIVIASLAFALMSGLRAAPAGADERDRKEAAELFKEGIKFFDRGEFAKACPKFEAALELFDGIGTRGKLAECYERQGRLASAWRLYREVVRLSKRRGEKRRAKVAAKRARKLKPRLPRLIIKGGPSESLDGFNIEHNRVELHASTYGKRIYVDPGTHLIVASAYDHKSWKKKVKLKLGQTRKITVPKLRPASSRLDADEPEVVDVDDSAGDTDSAGSVASARTDLFDDRPTSSSSGARVTGAVALGLGVIGMGVSMYLGYRAYDGYYDEESNPLCPPPPMLCDSQNEEEFEAVKRDANTSTVTFSAGAVLAATGVLLLWRFRKKPARAGVSLAPTFAPNAFGLTLSGSL